MMLIELFFNVIEEDIVMQLTIHTCWSFPGVESESLGPTTHPWGWEGGGGPCCPAPRNCSGGEAGLLGAGLRLAQGSLRQAP